MVLFLFLYTYLEPLPLLDTASRVPLRYALPPTHAQVLLPTAALPLPACAHDWRTA